MCSAVPVARETASSPGSAQVRRGPNQTPSRPRQSAAHSLCRRPFSGPSQQQDASLPVRIATSGPEATAGGLPPGSAEPAAQVWHARPAAGALKILHYRLASVCGQPGPRLARALPPRRSGGSPHSFGRCPQRSVRVQVARGSPLPLPSPAFMPAPLTARPPHSHCMPAHWAAWGARRTCPQDRSDPNDPWLHWAVSDHIRRCASDL